MTRWLPLACLALAAAALVAPACGDDEEETAPQDTSTASPGGNTSTASPGGNAVSVEADDFDFDPKELQTDTGQPLTVKIENSGKATHTFTIDDLDIDETVSPGEEATVTLTPTNEGTLEFYCRFHKSQGMVGTLKVGAGGSGQTMPTATKASAGPGFGY